MAASGLVDVHDAKLGDTPVSGPGASGAAAILLFSERQLL
jgi:hypothetical protein